MFANKAVMTTFGFHFIYALTLIHTLATLVGMKVFAYFGMFEKKKLPKLSIASLAGAYVGYIVLNNLNLQMNTVGFYQISKIAVAPAVRYCSRRHIAFDTQNHECCDPIQDAIILSFSRQEALTAGTSCCIQLGSVLVLCAGVGS